MNKMELIDWARNELELFDKAEKGKFEKESDVAYQTFRDFLNREEELNDIGLSASLLIKLLLEDPLTPIEDDEESWEQVMGCDTSPMDVEGWFSLYQCKRRGSLFKRVHYNPKTGLEEINYSDLERAVCVDIETGQSYQPTNLELCVLDDADPISMPYTPTDKIKIFVDRFRYYKDSQDFDTIGILAIMKPKEDAKEIMRWFKRNQETNRWETIRKVEYFGRKVKVKEERR